MSITALSNNTYPQLVLTDCRGKIVIYIYVVSGRDLEIGTDITKKYHFGCLL